MQTKEGKGKSSLRRLAHKREKRENAGWAIETVEESPQMHEGSAILLALLGYGQRMQARGKRCTREVNRGQVAL